MENDKEEGKRGHKEHITFVRNCTIYPNLAFSNIQEKLLNGAHIF